MIGWIKPTLVIKATPTDSEVSLNCTFNDLLELSKSFNIIFEEEVEFIELESGLTVHTKINSELLELAMAYSSGSSTPDNAVLTVSREMLTLNGTSVASIINVVDFEEMIIVEGDL